MITEEDFKTLERWLIQRLAAINDNKETEDGT